MIWWWCPLCQFRMTDDGSVGATRTMSEHIAFHEGEEKEREKTNQLSLWADARSPIKKGRKH